MTKSKRTNKRYYFLQLQEGFFGQPLMKKLRRMAGGDTYTIIYLKMQLLTLKSSGILYYEGIEDEICEELATVLDENVEDVKMTWIFLMNYGLIIEEQPEMTYFLPEAAENMGSITDSSLRSRKSRLQQRQQATESALQCNTTATQLQHTNREEEECVAMQHNCNTLAAKCNLEREIEIDIDIEREENTHSTNFYKGILNNVSISYSEYCSLKETYENVNQLLDHVSTILANSKPKDNHYAFILRIAMEDNWPKHVKRFSEQEKGDPRSPLMDEQKNSTMTSEEKLCPSNETRGMPESMRKELEIKYGYNFNKG